MLSCFRHVPLRKSCDFRLHRSRSFCSSTSSETVTQIDKIKLQLPQIAAVMGGTLVVYGVSKLVMFVTGQFMSINFTTVGMIGFGAG